MKYVSAETHEQWKQYIVRGGVLNLSSFVRFQERYPAVLRDLEHEALSDAHDASSEAGFRVSSEFCAAFGALREEDLDLRTTDASPIYWRSNEWTVREALLLINDKEATRFREPTY